MMNNNRVYDLSGLQLLYIGIAVSVLGGVINSFLSRASDSSNMIDDSISPATVFSILVSLAVIVAFVVILIGLNKLKPYSVHFSKAMQWMLIMVGVLVFFAVVLVVAIMNWKFTLALVMGIIGLCGALVFGFLSWREIFLGVSDIPAGCGDTIRYGRCMKLWQLMKIGLLVGAGLVLCIAVTAYVGMRTFSPASAKIIIFFAVLLIIWMLVMLTIIAMFLLLMHQIHVTYNGQPIGMRPQQPYAPGGVGQNVRPSGVDMTMDAFFKVADGIGGKSTQAPRGPVGPVGTPARPGQPGAVGTPVRPGQARPVGMPAPRGPAMQPGAPASRGPVIQPGAPASRGPVIQPGAPAQMGRVMIGYCHMCGEPLYSDDRFCGRCGTKISNNIRR